MIHLHLKRNLHSPKKIVQRFSVNNINRQLTKRIKNNSSVSMNVYDSALNGQTDSASDYQMDAYASESAIEDSTLRDLSEENSQNFETFSNNFPEISRMLSGAMPAPPASGPRPEMPASPNEALKGIQTPISRQPLRRKTSQPVRRSAGTVSTQQISKPQSARAVSEKELRAHLADTSKPSISRQLAERINRFGNENAGGEIKQPAFVADRPSVSNALSERFKRAKQAHLEREESVSRANQVQKPSSPQLVRRRVRSKTEMITPSHREAKQSQSSKDSDDLAAPANLTPVSSETTRASLNSIITRSAEDNKSDFPSIAIDVGQDSTDVSRTAKLDADNQENTPATSDAGTSIGASKPIQSESAKTVFSRPKGALQSNFGADAPISTNLTRSTNADIDADGSIELLNRVSSQQDVSQPPFDGNISSPTDLNRSANADDDTTEFAGQVASERAATRRPNAGGGAAEVSVESGVVIPSPNEESLSRKAKDVSSTTKLPASEAEMPESETASDASSNASVSDLSIDPSANETKSSGTISRQTAKNEADNSAGFIVNAESDGIEFNPSVSNLSASKTEINDPFTANPNLKRVTREPNASSNLSHDLESMPMPISPDIASQYGIDITNLPTLPNIARTTKTQHDLPERNNAPNSKSDLGDVPTNLVKNISSAKTNPLQVPKNANRKPAMQRATVSNDPPISAEIARQYGVDISRLPALPNMPNMDESQNAQLQPDSDVEAEVFTNDVRIFEPHSVTTSSPLVGKTLSRIAARPLTYRQKSNARTVAQLDTGYSDTTSQIDHERQASQFRQTGNVSLSRRDRTALVKGKPPIASKPVNSKKIIERQTFDDRGRPSSDSNMQNTSNTIARRSTVLPANKMKKDEINTILVADEAPEIDLNEIASSVLPLVKRLLAIETERS